MSGQQFTCNTCGLAFPTPTDQRDHMKTEWHRYNLKRRVASLPSISEELFNEKVSAMGADEEAQAPSGKNKTITKKEQRKREKEIIAEKKRELLELARQKMLSSGAVLKVDENGKLSASKPDEQTVEPSKPETEEKKDLIPETTEEVEQNENSEESKTEENEATLEEQLMALKIKNKVEIPPEACLFCTKTFPHQNAAIQHMFKVHGMYIPEQDFLVDKAGLIHYLSEKVGFGNVCLVCNYQGKNLEAVRHHMTVKFHCKIPYETEDEKLEISDFYDFTKSYANVPEQETNDEDWEDVDDEEIGSDEGEEEEGGEILPQEVSYVNNLELHLPTGQKVGHRSLARYYRQNLKPDRELSEGQGTVVAAETRHFINNPMTQQEIMTQKRAWKNEKKVADVNDRRAAKFINNQPHYRDQLLQ